MGTLGKKDLTARLREKDNIDNSIPTIKTEAKKRTGRTKGCFCWTKTDKKRKKYFKRWEKRGL